MEEEYMEKASGGTFARTTKNTNETPSSVSRSNQHSSVGISRPHRFDVVDNCLAGTTLPRSRITRGIGDECHWRLLFRPVSYAQHHSLRSPWFNIASSQRNQGVVAIPTIFQVPIGAGNFWGPGGIGNEPINLSPSMTI